jgi:hypothetical protein
MGFSREASLEREFEGRALKVLDLLTAGFPAVYF